jgi:hypothetical protein
MRPQGNTVNRTVSSPARPFSVISVPSVVKNPVVPCLLP